MVGIPVELKIPVILGPMAGAGICTPELVAAVSNAGGLGTFAVQYLKPEVADAGLRRIRELTDRPFAINFFAPGSVQPLSGDVNAQIKLLAPIHARLGIEAPKLPEKIADYFEDYVDLTLRHGVKIVSYTMGVLPPQATEKLHRAECFVIGTATTVSEAQTLVDSGADAVIAQGGEAGGHRGSFDADAPAAVGTMALVPQVVDAVKVPVIASGGIMDGRGIVAALALGATAVQMGTAFLTTRESGAAESYKQAVLRATENSTALTNAFSGRWARGIRNEFMATSEKSGAKPIAFPWQNSLTGQMRAAAGKRNEPELLSLWAGQGTRLTREVSATELMKELEEEIRAVKKRLRS